MRTTLTLDDDVAIRLREESRRSGMPFKVIINEHLRAALARRQAIAAIAPFQVAPRTMGGPMPGLSYDDVGALLEEIESPHRR
jgi:hypothetical protein